MVGQRSRFERSSSFLPGAEEAVEELTKVSHSIRIAHTRARYYSSYIGAQRDRDGTLVEPAVGATEPPPILVHLRSVKQDGVNSVSEQTVQQPVACMPGGVSLATGRGRASE